MSRLNTVMRAVGVAALLAAGAAAGQDAATTLDALLEQVRKAATEEARINKDRENEFLAQRNQQQQLLAQARAELRAEENRSDQLKANFDDNEKQLAELETVRQERAGNLGEMFGVVRQMAGDLRGKLENSMTSAQYPGRGQFLKAMAESKALPNIKRLTELWYEFQRELTEQGKIETFQTDVLNPEGEVEADQTVTRIGSFVATRNGKFLVWSPPSSEIPDGVMKELKRQPANRWTSLVEDYESLAPGTTGPMAMDFTSGVILATVTQEKTIQERIQQGGTVGYVIIAIGIMGLLLAAYRGILLWLRGAAINKQLKREEADKGNALGRIMSVYQENPDTDIETLELKLDDAILRETGQLETGLSFIKVLYVVAPLLGLLGTVVGMIATFQQITLFGTGDPKAMAGGISQALMTTVLGLCVAIPLTLIHSLLASRSRTLIHVLEEQSAGIIARMAEKRD